MTQTPPPMAPPPVAMPGGQKKAVGIAVAALVLGICGFIPFLGPLCGLTGIILGIVALAQQTSRKGMAIAGIVTGVTGPVLMISLMVTLLVPALNHAKDQAKRVICKTNLHVIGRGICIYSAENNDAYPPDLKCVVKMYCDDEGQVLKCPSAKSGRDCDYFYFVSAATTMQIPDPSVSIIACDYKNNHGGKGRSVLFADGHVQWMTEKAFQQELQNEDNAAFAAALRKAEGP